MAQSSLSKLSICFGRFGNSQFWVAKNWLATKKNTRFFLTNKFSPGCYFHIRFLLFFRWWILFVGFLNSDTCQGCNHNATLVRSKQGVLVSKPAESSCNSLTEKFQAIKKYLSTSTQQIYTGKKPWRIMKILWMIFFSEVTFHWRKIY